MKSWVRVTANMSLGAYEIFEASGDLPEPVWPDFSFQEILKIAFRDRIVDRDGSSLGAAAARDRVAMVVTTGCRRRPIWSAATMPDANR